MGSITSPLKGKRVGVIGFNARPIAWSAKKAGASVIVSDYWGDDDLSACCESWIAVLTPKPGARQRQPLDMPLPVALVDNLLYLAKDKQLDMVLIGSGFDDHSEAIEPLEDLGLVVGCSSSEMDRARDYDRLRKITKKLDVLIPSRRIFNSPDEIEDHSFEFPCVVRPRHSGGGSGVRLARTKKEIIAAFPEQLDEEELRTRVVQDYVGGSDMSCSVLSTGEIALGLSVQGQLIGMPTAGRNCGFAYCGNYLPSGLTQDLENQIYEIFEEVSTKLGLKGSIGIDFVVDDKEQVWLMEVNPRIQGSLELIELAGNVSVTEMHVRASLGVLPEKRPLLKAGVKMVVYSRRDGVVPDLTQYANTVDRTPQGVRVNLGDPICTIREIGESLKECYRETSRVAELIQRGIKPSDNISS
jgi:predicted ATP-grasp superfamily ATP-dependent carboligase